VLYPRLRVSPTSAGMFCSQTDNGRLDATPPAQHRPALVPRARTSPAPAAKLRHRSVAEAAASRLPRGQANAIVREMRGFGASEGRGRAPRDAPGRSKAGGRARGPGHASIRSDLEAAPPSGAATGKRWRALLSAEQTAREPDAVMTASSRPRTRATWPR
jgi:hypothetical protein